MAVRFNGSGDILKRTANLPTTSAWTICGWARFVSIRTGEYQYFAELANGTSNAGSYLVIGYRSGTSFEIATGLGLQAFASAPTTGTWFYWALTSNGTNLVGYWAHAGSSLVTATLATQSFTSAQLSIGNDSWDEWCDIEMAHTLVYDAALSQSELEQQMYRALPVRFANLSIWSPLHDQNDVVDYSGNGRSWTTGGSLAAASGPPLAWGVAPWVVPFVAAGGTTQTLAGSSAGVGSIAAAISAQLALAGSAAGVAGVAAAINGSLAVAGSAAGQAASSGALVAMVGLAGGTAGQAAATAGLDVGSGLAGSSAGQAGADAALAVQVGVAGSAAGQAGVAAALNASVSLAAGAAAQAAATVDLAVDGAGLALSGSAAAVAGGSATLAVYVAVAGSSAGQAASSSLLSMLLLVIATSAAQASAMATLSLADEEVYTASGTVSGPAAAGRVYGAAAASVVVGSLSESTVRGG